MVGRHLPIEASHLQFTHRGIDVHQVKDESLHSNLEMKQVA